MKTMKYVSMVAFALSGLFVWTGCEIEPAPPHRVVVQEYDAEPGYYYEPEYYDAVGVYHPRVYFYFDGHHYERRGYIPRGYAAHERHFEEREHRR